MKMTLSIVLIAFTFFIQAHCQTFMFDKLVTIEKTVQKKKKEISSQTIKKLINSKNPNQYLEFKGDSIAQLRENDNLIFHDFKIIKYISEGELELMYVRSCNETDLTTNREEAIKHERVELIRLNENQFEFKTFQKKKSKKPLMEVKFTLVESEQNQLSLLSKLSDELANGLTKILDSSKNYSITELSFWEKGKLNSLYKLQSVEDNRLKIILPRNLKYECL